MIRRISTLLTASWLVLTAVPTVRAGDYDQALFVISLAFPELKNIGVFYDQKGALLNLLEFETSASKRFGVNIMLVPLDSKKLITPNTIRRTCSQFHIQGVLFIEDDMLVRPKSLAGNTVVSGAGNIPVVGINAHWLESGAWFVIGPGTNGLQISPKVKDPKIREALTEAARALSAEDL